MIRRILGAIGSIALLGSQTAFAQEATEPSGVFDFLPLLILIVVFGGIFYFMLIRPQRRRQQKMSTLIEGLHRGDGVITAGGIHGDIDSIGDTSVVLNLEDGSKLRIAKTSIVKKLEK
ncbi:MAG: preprotein translocase subunit YajC [Candidatus Bipolaricaulia bacterium]